jgi:hypothetical protein
MPPSSSSSAVGVELARTDQQRGLLDVVIEHAVAESVTPTTSTA